MYNKHLKLEIMETQNKVSVSLTLANNEVDYLKELLATFEATNYHVEKGIHLFDLSSEKKNEALLDLLKDRLNTFNYDWFVQDEDSIHLRSYLNKELFKSSDAHLM